jgi:hypothetical protein
MITIIKFLKIFILSSSILILIIFGMSSFENYSFEKIIKEATKENLPCYLASNNSQDLIGCYNKALRYLYTSFEEEEIIVGYSTLDYLCNVKRFETACSSIDIEVIRTKEHLIPSLFNIQKTMDESAQLVHINSQMQLGTLREFLNDNSLWPFVFDSMDSKLIYKEKLNYLSDGIYHTNSNFDEKYLKINLHLELKKQIQNSINCKLFIENEFYNPKLNLKTFSSVCNSKIFNIEKYLYYLPFIVNLSPEKNDKRILDIESWKLKEFNSFLNFSNSNLSNNFKFKKLPPRNFSKHTRLSEEYEYDMFDKIISSKNITPSDSYLMAKNYYGSLLDSCFSDSTMLHCENIITFTGIDSNKIIEICTKGNKFVCDYLNKRDAYEGYLHITKKQNQYIKYDRFISYPGGTNIQNVLSSYKNSTPVKFFKKIERFIIPFITIFLFIFVSTTFLVLTSSEKLKFIKEYLKKNEISRIRDKINKL